MPSTEQWITDHVKRLEAKASLTDDQQTFMELAGKTERTKEEETRFRNALAIEKAKDKLAKVKRRSQLAKSTEKKEARKERDHQLYNSAGLMIVADVVDSETGIPRLDRAELVGALLGLANVPKDDPRRAEWKRIGKEKLDQAKAKKTKTTEPA